ncbi:tetratricopeptide repeat protein [Pseudonocardia ailaonensis]
MAAVLALVVVVAVNREDTAPVSGAAADPPPTADPLGADIAGIQAQLKITPNNADGWATLGLDYVQEAKNTVNPMYYPKAEGALARSLQIMPTGNAAALAGQAALRAAQHRFADSLTLAQQAQALDPQNSMIYGTLADAYTQLGRYDDARGAVQQMLNLHPGTPAYTRAEYVYELAGQPDQARVLMNQALDEATAPADIAFCRYYLAELAFTGGDPAEALRQVQLGTQADPRYPDLLEGQAKAEAALGQEAAAVADYAQLLASTPQPQFVIEAGEYLESIGHMTEAQQAYALFDAENSLFTSNGVQLDTDPTLFYADHGDPAKALSFGEAGLRIRPFVEMDDAYGWALHANGRDAEALTWANKAAATGMRNALFAFHKGMIENSLGQKDAARTDLSAALAINPHFDPLQVPVARATLTQLGGPR